jgi:phosphoribosyl 1,2-cyclic phosphodiesterase
MRADSNFSQKSSVLLVLREWNSYTPVIPSDQETDRGGGYFLYHHGKGIVIDPGYDFLENFYRAGGRVHDIDAVVITHAHDDHTADFEALMTLLHQYNRRDENTRKKKRVTLCLSIGAERKLSGFYQLRGDSRLERLIIMNRCEVGYCQSFEIFAGIRLTVLPAYHDDLMTTDSSVGLCFDLTFGTQHRRVVFTGDTGLYPKDLEPNGKPRQSAADKDNNRSDLLQTGNEKLALHRRYQAVLRQVDGAQHRAINLLIPHLGSVKDYELDPPVSEPDKQLLYPNHLGLRGVAILISQTKPDTVILSEFGSELKDIKVEICRLLQDALCSDASNGPSDQRVFPGDLTIVYDIDQARFLCHTNLTFLESKDLEAIEENGAPDERAHTFLFESGASGRDNRKRLVDAYYRALSERTLPYFKPRP